MKRNLFLLTLAMILGITIQSCRETGLNPWEKPKDENPIENPDAVPMTKLQLTSWRLTAIENGNTKERISTTKNDNIILTVGTDNGISGNTNCNVYGAQYSSEKPGQIKIFDLISTEAFCGDLDNMYYKGLRNAVSYGLVNNNSQLHIYYTDEATGANVNTLVFESYTKPVDEIDVRLRELESHIFTLHSFVNAGNEEILAGSDKCTISFMPNYFAPGIGIVNFLAICNKGYADLSFNQDYTAMSLSHIIVGNAPCENQNTADRFVDFLRNVGAYEFSDYGTTLTIWSSLTTFAESKMVLKVVPPVVDEIIDIIETPSTGVPKSSYPMLYLEKLDFDGSYINLAYKYGGKTDDYRISAYSNFVFSKSNPPVVFIDLVADGSSNPISSLTEGRVKISLNELRIRVQPPSPGTVKMKVIFRFEGNPLAESEIEVML